MRRFRSISAKKAVRNGNAAENAVVALFQANGWNAVRVPNGGRMVGPSKFIPIKSPFDYVFLKSGASVFVDIKSTTDKSFRFSKIKKHQLVALSGCERSGAVAGYIVYFSKDNLYRFFTASLLASANNRGSFSPDEGAELKTMFGINA